MTLPSLPSNAPGKGGLCCRAEPTTVGCGGEIAAAVEEATVEAVERLSDPETFFGRGLPGRFWCS